MPPLQKNVASVEESVLRKNRDRDLNSDRTSSDKQNLPNYLERKAGPFEEKMHQCWGRYGDRKMGTFTIDFGTNRFPRLRYARCDDCVCIEQGLSDLFNRRLPNDDEYQQKRSWTVCTSQNYRILFSLRLYWLCINLSYTRFKTSVRLHIDPMMRTRIFRVRSEIAER